MLNMKKFGLAIVAAAFLLVGLAACDGDSPGEVVDDAIDDTGDAIEDAGDAIEDAVDDAGD